MAEHALKEMSRHGRLKVGTFVVEFSTPGIGQLLKAAGCEFVLLDMEHSGFGFDTVKQMLRYMQAGDMPAIVRVPSREYHHAARAMDMGAEGIMLPMVGSAAAARELLSYVKYAPDGERGVALQIAHDRYAPGPVQKKLRDANERCTFVALIETAEGVENAEEIAAIEDVDILWIGHFDLSVSMGIAGQFDHPDFTAAVARVVRAAKKHNKSLGRLVPNVDVGVALFKEGFDFICYSGDVWLLQQAMREGAEGLRAQCKRGGGGQRNRGVQQVMADKFRVALSRDFLTAEGEPLFPMFDRTPLDEDPDIEWHYLENGDGPVDAAELAGHDALVLLAQRFDRSSVPGDGRLAMVARFGVGYDSVDVPACSDNGIALVITPNGVRRPVAVAIIALILAVMGKLLLKDQLTREGPPGFARKGAHMGVGLVGKTLGSVGIGNIGAEMFRLAAPFDMNFMACDPYADPAVAAELGVQMVDLDTLCREADILAVNCPLSDATHHIVDARLIASMKPTAYLVNTSRGGTVDQKALTAALQEGRIAGAGLDVLDPEPPEPDDPILKLDNVVFAPHALAWTDQCFAGLGADDIVACKALMRGEEPQGIVNGDIRENEAWRAKLARYGQTFGR